MLFHKVTAVNSDFFSESLFCTLKIVGLENNGKVIMITTRLPFIKALLHARNRAKHSDDVTSFNPHDPTAQYLSISFHRWQCESYSVKILDKGHTFNTLESPSLSGSNIAGPALLTTTLGVHFPANYEQGIFYQLVSYLKDLQEMAISKINKIYILEPTWFLYCDDSLTP